MIATEPQPSHHPGKTTLNEPPLGLRSKAGGKDCLPGYFCPFGYQQTTFGDRERMDRLDGPAQLLFDPGQKGPAIMAVTPDTLHTGKQLCEGREQGMTSLLIGFLGSRHLHSQQIARLFHERVANASPDFGNLSKGVTPFTRLQNWT